MSTVASGRSKELSATFDTNIVDTYKEIENATILAKSRGKSVEYSGKLRQQVQKEEFSHNLC